MVRNGTPTPIQPGTAQPGDTPYDAVAARNAKPANTDDAKAVTEDAIAIADRLLSNPDVSKAYGAYEMRGWTQGARDAKALRDQLVAQLTLPNLGALKGPMSDKDVAFVKQISTRLADSNISDEEAVRALNDARDFLERKLGSRVPRGSLANRVPADVADALKAAGPGLHTGNDGTQWMVAADGSITRVK